MSLSTTATPSALWRLASRVDGDNARFIIRDQCSIRGLFRGRDRIGVIKRNARKACRLLARFGHFHDPLPGGRWNKAAGHLFMGVKSSLPTQTPVTLCAVKPMYQASR